jgi:flagellar motor switch protein FliN/FliY
MAEEGNANEQFTADDWSAAMAEQTSAETPAEPAADDWGAAMAEQGAAEPAADDWGAAMSEQATAEAASTQPQGTPKVFDNISPDVSGLSPEGAKNLDMVMDIPVQLTVELGRTRMPIRNLLQLAQGSVVELNELAGEPLDVFVNGCLVAQGEVVVVNEKFGIRFTDIITPSERLKKLR